MRRAREQTTQSEAPIEQQGSKTSLRQEVKESLLLILRDPGASATAKASASRTLLEYFDSDKETGNRRRGAELSAAELDAAIAELE